MKQKKPFLLIIFIIPLFFISCSKEEYNDIESSKSPNEIAKNKFSESLKIWNDPNNFIKKEKIDNKTNLKKRLKFIRSDAENYLLTTGESQEVLNTYTDEEIFSKAILNLSSSNNQ